MKQLFATLSALALLGAGAVAQDSPAVQPNTPPAAVATAPDPAAAPAPAATPATAEPTPAPAAPAAAPATDGGSSVAAIMKSDKPAADVVQRAMDDKKAANDPVEEDVEVLPVWEMIVFCIVVIGVIGLGIWKSGTGDKKSDDGNNEESGAADYFLAGRGLSWWLVGFSLLAANISTEQFVGMSGQAADWLGIAIAGYEWLAAIVLVIVAFTFLPMLLKRGVFTIPQFLEERFNGSARVTMAIANLLILVGVPTAAVIYAGSTVVSVYFDLPVTAGCIIIAVCATVYVYVGGLKACAWTDLIWGAGLLVGGGVVAYFALSALGSMDPYAASSAGMIDSASISATNLVNGDVAGAMQSTGSTIVDGVARLWTLNDGEATSAVNGIGGKLHMMRPDNDPTMPWTIYLLGLWIPNFFYWGLNQYIMQRTLASKSLEEGQLGVVFAAFLKLLVPFVVIVPGILAYNLFRDDLKTIADERSDKIIQTVAEQSSESGKLPIYKISATRLIRADVEMDALKLIAQNADNAGATTEQKARLITAAENLHMIPAAETEKRAAAADAVLKIDEEITKEACQNTDKYSVTTALVGYHYDSAFATLLKRLLPNTGWAWFVLAALFGAVVSSLASMFNSASTLFTMDIYGKAKELTGKPASSAQLVSVGRWSVLVLALIATVIAPYLDNPAFGGIYTFIQEFQGFLSPGVLAVFIFGFFVPKCPRVFGWLGIVLGIVVYTILKLMPIPEDNETMKLLFGSFLNRMAISFVIICLVGVILTLINHLRGGEAVILQDKGIIEMKSSARAKIFGAIVIAITVALYIIFW